MKLIIDIPDRIHFGIKKGFCVNGSDASQIVLDAIKNGTPLNKIRDEIGALAPKGTAEDVIDGNPIKEAVWETIYDVLQILDKYKAESEG